MRQADNEINDLLAGHLFEPAAEINMQDTILALDPGAMLGWALQRHDGTIASGTVSFQPASFEGEGMRFVRFARWLGELHAVVGGVHALYFVEVRNHPSIDVAHRYGGFLAQLSAWCEAQSVSVPTGTIKKHATGRGDAAKVDLIAAARLDGHHPYDGNEATALALLRWAIESRGGGSA